MRIAEEIAREAGDLIRSNLGRKISVAGTKSSVSDIVTQMDLAAEDLLRERLAELRPGDGVLGEEHGLEPSTTGLTWVLDPIDGTVNFLYGLPAHAVSVAVVAGAPVPETWDPLAAAVHQVSDGTTWTAGAGAGAYVDGVRLPHILDRGLDNALLATGFGYRVERRSKQARVLTALLSRVRDVRRLGAASVDLCLVATGQVDGYYERGLNPWDMAAGALVARESGADVTGLRGAAGGEEMIVTGPPTLVRELAEALAELDADTDDLVE
jgi:myo-inositol-1(or 4)-monophosphatase